MEIYRKKVLDLFDSIAKYADGSKEKGMLSNIRDGISCIPLHENENRYLSQRHLNSECMVVALANCHTYLDKEKDCNFWDWLEWAKVDCKKGPYLKYQEAIKGLKLPLHQTDHWDDLKDCGGILEIIHPIFNLHAVFISPIDKEKCIAYNSWLGPEKCVLSWAEISRFVRKAGTPKHYYIKRTP